MNTKQERREQRRQNRRKMRVSGKSVHVLQTLVQQRAQQAKQELEAATGMLLRNKERKADATEA